MVTRDITLSAPVVVTPRVQQVAAMMDLPVDEKTTRSWHHVLPVDERPWNVGLVVGPSGSGKSVLAREVWPDALVGEQEWSRDRALLDDFPDMPIREITGLLTSVGLGSVPAWLRPHSTLSNGEAFRASIARALAETDGLVVVDEFTSVVDRQVARVASHTVQKTVRRSDRQFVAVTCHYDVLEWLQPDWVYDVATSKFQWRSQKSHPPIHLDIHRAERSEWPLFAPHHYLSSRLHTAARCFTAWSEGQPVAFTAYIHHVHPSKKARNIRTGHRLVVLPDFQGLGIAGRLDDWLGQYLYERGFRYHNTVSHPAMIRYYTKSPRWTLYRRSDTQIKRALFKTQATFAERQTKTRTLGQRSFEYRPPKAVAA